LPVTAHTTMLLRRFSRAGAFSTTMPPIEEDEDRRDDRDSEDCASNSADDERLGTRYDASDSDSDSEDDENFGAENRSCADFAIEHSDGLEAFLEMMKPFVDSRETCRPQLYKCCGNRTNAVENLTNVVESTTKYDESKSPSSALGGLLYSAPQ